MLEKPTIFRVIDFETTGDAPDGEVIEIGWTDVIDGQIRTGDHGHFFVRNERPISVETMAVHHLQDRDVVCGLGRDDAFQMLQRAAAQANVIYVAHGAKTEQSFFPEAAENQWICTYKCALRLYPDAPKFSNQVLRYHLGFFDLAPGLAMPPHRAKPDSYVTANILMKMLETTSVEQLIQWSKEPGLLPKCMIGDEHRGKTWDQVDEGFLYWILRKDFSEDVIHTVNIELERRRAEREREEEMQRADEPVPADVIASMDLDNGAPF